MMSERLGHWHFWLMVIGFNLTFGPQHVAGVPGMPPDLHLRRGPRLGVWKLLSSLGALIQAVAVLIFV